MIEVKADHSALGDRWLYCDGHPELLILRKTKPITDQTIMGYDIGKGYTLKMVSMII